MYAAALFEYVVHQVREGETTVGFLWVSRCSWSRSHDCNNNSSAGY
jgi:hypothetical protein